MLYLYCRRGLVAAILFLLTLCGNANAGLLWVEGFEQGDKNLACFTGMSQTQIATGSPASGDYFVLMEKESGMSGTCNVTSGLGATGTVYLFFRIRVVPFTTCTNTPVGSVADWGDVDLKFTCPNGTTDYTLTLETNGAQSGNTYALPTDTWVPFLIEVATGNGTGTTKWYQESGGTWSQMGSTHTGRTVTSIDGLTLSAPLTASGNHFQYMGFDDIYIGTGDMPTPNTYVNIRKGDSNGTYNNWPASTKVNNGTGSSNIWAVWESSPVSYVYSTNHDGTTSDNNYAQSNAGDDTTGQTMGLSAWDSGTPTPAIPASAAGVDFIHGCRYQAKAGRTTGTNRTYQLRYIAIPSPAPTAPAATPTPIDTQVTLSAETYLTFNVIITSFGSGVATRLNYLNGLEVGGYKSATASGASMDIADVWVQCAWSNSGSGNITYFIPIM